MDTVINWMLSSPAGIFVAILVLVLFFGLWAFLSERRTRKMYRSRDEQGKGKKGAKKGGGVKTKAASAKATDKNGSTKAATATSTAKKKAAASGDGADTAPVKKKPRKKTYEEFEDEGLAGGFLESLWAKQDEKWADYDEHGNKKSTAKKKPAGSSKAQDASADDK
jgi:hypothetical protein